MNAERKRFGTKAQIKAMKGRERRTAKALFVAFILLAAIFSAYLASVALNQPRNETTSPAPAQLKAAIVDQASLSPAGGYDENFVENVTSILEKAGYNVDYYPGEKVTIDFYRNLPANAYQLIILRVHSGAHTSTGTINETQITDFPVSFFTSESYSQAKYIREQLSSQLAISSYSRGQPPYYFAIKPTFVTSCMKGYFPSSIIIMTGCEGLNNTIMAQAFIDKGAKAYIGWDKAIYFSHTDTATVHLLRCLFEGKQTIKLAVDNTMKTVGPDPAENSTLTYYPPQAGGQTVESIESKNSKAP